MREGEWYFSPDHGEFCRVIETQTLSGVTVCRVCLPGKDTVVRLPATRLRPTGPGVGGAVARKIPENVLQEDPKLLMWYEQALTRTEYEETKHPTKGDRTWLEHTESSFRSLLRMRSTETCSKDKPAMSGHLSSSWICL